MYNTAFSKEDIGEFTLEKAKELSLVLWDKNSTTGMKVEALNKFCKEVAPKYDIRVPRVRFNKMLKEMEIYGTSNFANGEIVLGNFSFVTFLHEFRHQIQYKLFGITDDIRLYFKRGMRDKMEEDARGWSVSIFYILHPDKYKKAVDNNRLVFK